MTETERLQTGEAEASGGDAPPLHAWGAFRRGGGAPLAPPDGGRALWLNAADGVRLRAALWPEGRRGSAVFFQGRTEFIEKFYEPVARARDLGFAAATLDWRGQGRSDRLLADRRKGYVAHFSDFQKDVDALLAALAAHELPRPWVLFGHSMGGAVAARTLMRQSGSGVRRDRGYGAPIERGFAAAVLTAPMLGLAGAAGGLAAAAAARFAVVTGRARNYVSGAGPTTAADDGFDGNALTSDAKRFAECYAEYLAAAPELALGGATWGWLRAAQREMRLLKPTKTPTLVAVGEKEAVVSVPAIERYVARAPDAVLLRVPGARHEPLIEVDRAQERLWTAISSFFDEHNL